MCFIYFRASARDGLKVFETHPNLFVDLAAEEMVVAQRDGRKIAVEIKTFGRASIVQDLKDMVGSFQVYRDLLAETAPDFQLFVAISQVTYESDFDLPIAQFLVTKNHIPLIIVDVISARITQWKQP